MDPTIIGLTLSVSAYCAIAVTVMVATLAARGHPIGRPGQFVGIASGVTIVPRGVVEVGSVSGQSQ